MIGSNAIGEEIVVLRAIRRIVTVLALGALPLAAPAAALGSYGPITNYNSRKCVDVTNRSTANGALIQQWDCTRGSNQQWEIRALGQSGYFQIVNQNSQKCLDVTGRATYNGALIQQWDCTGGSNQAWQLIAREIGPGAFDWEIQNQGSHLVLDVRGASKLNGGLIQQWAFNGGWNQLWSGSAL